MLNASRSIVVRNRYESSMSKFRSYPLVSPEKLFFPLCIKMSWYGADLGRQTAITRDNVNVDIDSVIYFQITSQGDIFIASPLLLMCLHSDPYRSAFGITDLHQALTERAQTTLRHVVGARTVQSVVVEREAIALEIDSILSEIGDKWGVSIEGILIK